VPKKNACPIRDAIGSVLSPVRIDALARELGVVKRQRKVRATVLVGVIVLGFGCGVRRSLAGMRRAYHRCTGQALAPSGFYARFTEELVLLLKRLVEEVMAELQVRSPRLTLSLRRFNQLLIADGSLVTLHSSLTSPYRGVFTKGAAKLHVVINAIGRNACNVELARGSRQDVKILKIGPWVAGKLLLLDLGYRKGSLYKNIADHGGYFLIRKKETCDPIVADAPWSGARLSTLLAKFEGKPIDVMADVLWRQERGRYAKRWRPLRVRIVGQWHPEESRHHFFVTNAPAEMMLTEHVGPIYAARWEVELFFRELKTAYRLDQLPTRKRFVVEALIYAAVLSLLLSRRLKEKLFRNHAATAIERWARVFACLALDILVLVLDVKAYSIRLARRLVRLLRVETPDPNKRRPPLLARAQLAVFPCR